MKKQILVLMLASGLASVPCYASRSKSRVVAEAQEEAAAESRTTVSAEAPPSDPSLPELNGHRFLTTSLFGNPFVTDSVGMSMSGGVLTLQPPAAADGTQADSMDFAGLTPTVQLQKSIGPWAAISFTGATTFLAATNDTTAGTLSENAGFSISPGVLVKLFRNDVHTLALVGSFTYGTNYSLSPLNAIVTAAHTQQVSLSNLLIKSTSTEWAPGVRYAVGAFDMLGFLAESDLVLDSSKTGGQDSQGSTYIRTAASLSFNLKPRTVVPLGFVAGISHDFGISTQLVDGASQTVPDVNRIALGLFETGARNFDLGAEFDMFIASNTTTDLGSLVMRYYY
jgi:hypothetical protein